jgi:hypothetical protein
MHFNVDAVTPEQFAEWAASARKAGSSLDAQAYAELVKPSKAVVPFTYRSIAPDLFNSINSSTSAGLKPGGGVCVPYPSSMRAER